MKTKNFDNLMALLLANSLYSALSKPGTNPIIVACSQKNARRISLWLENNGVHFQAYSGEHHSYNKYYKCEYVFQLMSTDCISSNGFSCKIVRILSLLITNDKNAYPFKKNNSVATELEYLVIEKLIKSFDLTKIQDIHFLLSKQDLLHMQEPYGFKYVIDGLLSKLKQHSFI